MAKIETLCCMNARTSEDFPLIYLFIFSISMCLASHCQGENIEENEEGNAVENRGKGKKPLSIAGCPHAVPEYGRGAQVHGAIISGHPGDCTWQTGERKTGGDVH